MSAPYPRPTVVCPWSKARKSRRLRAINKALTHLRSDEVAYFEDEVDIHLNPRLGRDCPAPLQYRRPQHRRRRPHT